MNFWIVKSEPEAYSWEQLEKDKTTAWTGVRNFQARKNLRNMQVGDICFFYHSGKERQIVGITKVTKPAYADPTAPGEDWSCVDITIVRKLVKPIPLSVIKSHPALEKIALVRQGRLSVSPITAEEYRILEKLNT